MVVVITLYEKREVIAIFMFKDDEILVNTRLLIENSSVRLDTTT